MGLTLCGNLFGLGACALLVAGSLPLAFLCVIVAMLLDMLDGPLARKTGVTSKAGGWLDALTDVCIYVLFPAVFWWQSYGLPALVLAVFIGAGVFRLIRFTLQGFHTDKAKLFYPGMPVFYSQFLLILTYALRFDPFVLGALLVLVAALNISLIPFVKIPVRVLSAGLVLYIAIVVLRISHAL
jgi:CDP-diacylglycerol--serine O-phosphatidyltransferase